MQLEYIKIGFKIVSEHWQMSQVRGCSLHNSEIDWPKFDFISDETRGATNFERVSFTHGISENKSQLVQPKGSCAAEKEINNEADNDDNNDQQQWQ